MDFRATQTFKNLANAFAGESQARTRYSFAAEVAGKEGHKQIQAAFESTADNEKEHAKVFFRLLKQYAGSGIMRVDADYPIVDGNTAANLKAAAEGEHEEWSVLYSKFGQVARQEGFPDVAQAFETIAEVEKHHEERFLRLANDLAHGTLYQKGEPVQWKCLNCGYVHTGPEAPGICPACQHPRGFFEVLSGEY